MAGVITVNGGSIRVSDRVRHRLTELDDATIALATVDVGNERRILVTRDYWKEVIRKPTREHLPWGVETITYLNDRMNAKVLSDTVKWYDTREAAVAALVEGA